MGSMGLMGYMMSGGGTDICWEMVYAGNLVARTMTGHAYSQALGVCLFSTSSLMSDLLRSPDSVNGVDTSHLKMLLESVLDSHDHAVVAVDQTSLLLVHQSHLIITI